MDGRAGASERQLATLKSAGRQFFNRLLGSYREHGLINLNQVEGSHRSPNRVHVAVEGKLPIQRIVSQQQAALATAAAELGFAAEVVARRAVLAEAALVLSQPPEGLPAGRHAADGLLDRCEGAARGFAQDVVETDGRRLEKGAVVTQRGFQLRVVHGKLSKRSAKLKRQKRPV